MSDSAKYNPPLAGSSPLPGSRTLEVANEIYEHVKVSDDQPGEVVEWITRQLTFLSSSSAPGSVEEARQTLEKAIVCLLQVASNHIDEFGRRVELAEGEVTLAIDALIAALQPSSSSEKSQ